MTTTVERLSRAPGSTRSPNVRVVDRSTPWGNPFRVTRDGGLWLVEGGTFRRNGLGSKAHALELAVVTFEAWARQSLDPGARWIRDHVHELAGYVLGCWCDQAGPCHAQVLARMADETDRR